MTEREIAEKLWDLLDNIDTASDRFKPSDGSAYRWFYNYAMKQVEQRHSLMKSDGYTLALLGESPKPQPEGRPPMRLNASPEEAHERDRERTVGEDRTSAG